MVMVKFMLGKGLGGKEYFLSTGQIGPLVETPKTEVSNDILRLKLQKGFHNNLISKFKTFVFLKK